jgi:hypothetical protein
MHRADETIIVGTPATPDQPRRRFNLGDVMVLVAASAIALVLLKTAVGLRLFTPAPKSLPFRNLIEYLSVAGGCILVPLTLALIASSLRDRRASRRDVIQGVGFVSCVTLVLAAILPVVYFMVRVAKAQEWLTDDGINPDLAVGFNNMFGVLKLEAGPMIAGAWLALALTGRWRVGPSWPDRVGCLVGACYILMYAQAQLYFVLSPLFE